MGFVDLNIGEEGEAAFNSFNSIVLREKKNKECLTLEKIKGNQSKESKVWGRQ